MRERLVVIAMLAACGGGNQPATTPDPGPVTAEDEPAPAEDEAQLVTPDTMYQIKRSFERKGPAVSRCLSMVVNNRELPRNARGKITLQVTITPSGAPGEIKVIKATLDNQHLTDCILEKVREIQFPEVPHDYPTTYTYGFEAM